MAKGETWTPDSEAELVRLAMDGKTPQEIANELDRSVRAVILRLTQIAEDRAQWSRALNLIKESYGTQSRPE